MTFIRLAGRDLVPITRSGTKEQPSFKYWDSTWGVYTSFYNIFEIGGNIRFKLPWALKLQIIFLGIEPRLGLDRIGTEMWEVQAW